MMYETVAIVGSVESAINMVVACFQVNHHGKLPQFVWIPRGKMPELRVVQGWMVRGVDLTESNHDGWTVKAK